jgi:hypothetical protein
MATQTLDSFSNVGDSPQNLVTSFPMLTFPKATTYATV